jgi:hypothetical protein
MKSLDIFNLPNPSNRIMALGLTQPLTEMSTRNLPGGKKGPTRRADKLATICEPKGLHSLYRDNVTVSLPVLRYLVQKYSECTVKRATSAQ